MKLQHDYDKLTQYQENLLQRIENRLEEHILLPLIIDEEKAWEQWQEKHYDDYDTVYQGAGVYTHGPDDWPDKEENILETQEGEERMFEVQSVIKFFEKYINDILAVPEEKYDTWYETTLAEDLSYDDETVRDCEDGDNVWKLIEFVLKEN